MSADCGTLDSMVPQGPAGGAFAGLRDLRYPLYR